MLLIATVSTIFGCMPEPKDGRTEPPDNVRAYMIQLEDRLAQRYNNIPEYAGKVSRVHLVIPSAPKVSVDGRELNYEFDQLVFDKWGERIPTLEKEYFLVTFGDGFPRLVRTDPTIRLGMELAGGYSESMPVNGGRLGQMLNPGTNTPETAPKIPSNNGIPVVPSVPDDAMPSTVITEAENDQYIPRAMQPPSNTQNTRIPHANVRNLPLLEPELE
jgi:hypothetical protein